MARVGQDVKSIFVVMALSAYMAFGICFVR